MIKFSKDKELLLHKLIAQETGGSIVFRDEALLDSALENAFAGFGGQEFYPTKEEKGRTARPYAHLQPRFCGRQQAHRYVRYADISGSERDTHGVYQRGSCGGRIIRCLRHNGL